MICEGFKTQIRAYMVESLKDKYSTRANRLELLTSSILKELWDLALTLDFREIYFSIFFTSPLIKDRTKHINKKYHLIWFHVEAKTIPLNHCSMNEQITDIFSKALGKQKFQKFRMTLRLLASLRIKGGIASHIILRGYDVIINNN